jgi:hypothetical protein
MTPFLKYMIKSGIMYLIASMNLSFSTHLIIKGIAYIV